MSKAIAVHAVPDITDDQMRLIKATVAKKATNDELALFLYRCKHMGLDPLKPGQIHFVKYGDSPGTIVIGIEGFRSKAAKTGKHSGTKRGTIKDEAGKCIGAWAEVYRADWSHPAREEVSLSEYNSGQNNWARMPETMIKKVAEVAALRMAFPDDLGGIYSDDEMENVVVAEVDSPPPPRNVFVETKKEREAVEIENLPFEHGEYLVPRGEHKGKKIKDIGQYKLQDWERFFDGKIRDGASVPPWVSEMLGHVRAFLAPMRERPAVFSPDERDGEG